MIGLGGWFRCRPWAAALLGYAVGAAVLTYPLAFRPGEGIKDLPAGDPGQHFWNIWWLGKALTDSEAEVFRTGHLFHPVGAGLAYHAYHPLLSLAVLALKPVVGAIPAYNLVLFLGPLASAWGMYLCAREWGAPGRAAWLAGFLFLFAPFRTEIWTHWEIQSTEWIPFYLLFLHRAVLRGGWRNIAGCSVFLIFTALTAWYHLASLLIMSCVLAPALVWARRDWGKARRRVIRLGLAAGLTVMVFSPYLRVLAEQRGASGEVPSLMSMHHWSSDVLNYVLPVPIQKAISPSLLRPYYRFEAFGNHLVYPGTALWMLVLAVVIGVRRKARGWPLFLSAGVLFVLSLGPVLKCGDLLAIPGTEIPALLPGYFLFREVPMLSALRTTCRLGIGVTPLFALFAAVNWERLAARMPKRFAGRQNVAIAAACAIALFEGWSAPLPMQPVEVPAIYATIAGDPEPTAVAEVPCTAIADLARSMYFQTFHGHPLVGGYLARPVPAFEAFAAQSPLVTFLRDPASARGYVFSAAMRRSMIEESRELGLGYIVVHGDRLGPEEKEGAAKLITEVLGCGRVAAEGEHEVYSLNRDGQD